MSWRRLGRIRYANRDPGSEIICPALLWIAEDFVCLVYFFEEALGFWIRIFVRMIDNGKLAVRPSNFPRWGVFRNAKYLVIIHSLKNKESLAIVRLSSGSRKNFLFSVFSNEGQHRTPGVTHNIFCDTSRKHMGEARSSVS